MTVHAGGEEGVFHITRGDRRGKVEAEDNNCFSGSSVAVLEPNTDRVRVRSSFSTSDVKRRSRYEGVEVLPAVVARALRELVVEVKPQSRRIATRKKKHLTRSTPDNPVASDIVHITRMAFMNTSNTRNINGMRMLFQA